MELKHPPLLEGTLISRPNRFLAHINLQGEEIIAHVPDPGRLPELMRQGARVLVRDNGNNPNRKTQYTLIMVWKDTGWVCINTHFANDIADFGIKNKIFKELAEFTVEKREYKVGNSRFDFYLKKNDINMLLEVKSVSLVINNHAYFPDAPSTRATKHLNELVELRRKDCRVGVLFILQRADADKVSPNGETDPQFTETLKRATKNGLEIFAYKTLNTELSTKILAPIQVIL